MPERFYEQDPNTGQRYYTEKGWSEWKPVPVEKDPSTGEEYELWNEQWMKKAPAEEVPAEMPSLAKGGMLVAGSANVAEDRMRRWKQANPKKAARAQKILTSGREIDPTGALGTELGMVLSGEWNADKPMDYATLSKAVKEQGQRAVEAKFDQQGLEDEVKKFEGMSPFVQPAYIAGRAVLSGVPTGVKGLVDIVRTIDDVITQSGAGDYRTVPLHLVKKHVLDPLSDSLDYTANTFQIKDTLDKAWGPKAKHWTEPLKPILQLPSVAAEMAPQLMAGNAAALEGMGAKAGDFTLKTLTRMGLPKAMRAGIAESVAGAVTNAPQQVVMDSFNEWGNATQDIRQQLIEQGLSEEEATQKALYQTRNLLQQNLALNTILAPLDAVSTIYGKTAMAKRIAGMEAKKASKAIKAVTGTLESMKTMATENFQERSQEALTMLAEQGKGWSYEDFVTNFNSDRAKEAGQVGGAFGLAMHVGGEFAESRAKKRAAKAQAAQDAMLRAGAESLRAEVEAQQAQEQVAPERPLAAHETSVAAEIERGVRPQEREAVEAIVAQAEPIPAPRPEGLAPGLAPAFEQVEGPSLEAAPEPEFYGADLVKQIQANSMTIPQQLRGRVGMELREISESQRAVDKMADMLIPVIERGQMPGASPNAVKAAEMAIKNLDEADSKHRGLVAQFESLTRPEVQRRILEARGGVNALSQRIVPEGRVQEYQQAREGGQAPEAGGGHRPGVGREVQAQAQAQVAPRVSKPVPVRVKVEGKTQTHMVDDPALIKEFRATMREDERAMSRIVNAPMTRAQRAEAIKAQKDKTAAKKRDIIDRWQNTRAAVKEATSLGAAQDITNALASAARIAYAVLQDLAAMGKVSFENFMAGMRSKPEYTALSRDLSEADFRRVYEQQRRRLEAGGTVRAASEGLRGDRSAYGAEVPADGEIVQRASRDLGQDTSLYGGTKYRLMQPGGKFYTRATQSGREALTKIDGDIGTTVIQTEGKPWVVDFTNVGDGTIHIDWITTGFDEARRKAETPQVGNIIEGGLDDLLTELALHAKAMGADRIEGAIIGPTEFAARMRYAHSEIGNVGRGQVQVTTPVDDVLNGDKIHNKWLHQDIDKAFIDLDDGAINEDEFRAKVSQALHGFTAEDFSGLQYMHSGLNPMVAIDGILKGLGYETIGKKLGIDWNTATPLDYAKAIVAAINGLGATVKATSQKIQRKLGIGESAATQVAQALHNMNETDQPIDPERIAIDVRRAVGSLNPDEFKTSPGDHISEELARNMKQVAGSHEYWSPYKSIMGSKAFNKMASKLPDSVRKAVYKAVGKTRVEPMSTIAHPKMVAARTRGNGGFDRLEEAARGWNNTKERTVNMSQDMVKAISSVAFNETQAKILGAALNVGTTIQGGVEWTDAHLEKAFPDINQETMDSYHTVVKNARELSSEMLRSFGRRVEQERKTILASMPSLDEKGRVRAQNTLDDLDAKFEKVKEVFSNKAYWPLVRRGNYFVSFTMPGTETHVASIMTEHDPASMEGRREIIRGWNAAMDFNPKLRELYQKGGINPLQDFQVLDKSQEFKTLQKAGIEYMDHALFEALEAVGDIDPEVSEAIGSILSARIAGDSMRNHMKNREGVAGSNTDPVLAMNAFIHMASNTIANNLHGKEINDSLAKVTDNTASNYDAGVAAYARQYVDDLKHPAPANWAHKLNRMGFLMALAGVPIFALVQRTQPWATLVPSLIPAYGAKQTVAAYAKAQMLADKMVAKSGIQDLIARSIPQELGEKDANALEEMLVEIVDKYDFSDYMGGNQQKVQELKQALKTVLGHAVTSGSLRPSASSDLMAAAGSIEGIKTKAEKIATLPASLSETSNRLAALFTYTLAAMKTGYAFKYTHQGRVDVPVGLDNILKTAIEVNAFNNFEADRAGKMPFQRSSNPMVVLMSLFKGYVAGYVSLMHFVPLMEYRRERTLGSSKGKAALAYLKARLGYDLSASMLGGPMAALDFVAVSLIARALAKMFDFDWEEFMENYVLDPIGEAMSQTAKDAGMSDDVAKAVKSRTKFAITHGPVSALTGVDISAAVRPDLFLGSGSDSIQEKAAAFIGGPALNTMATAAQSYIEGKSPTTAIKKLEPRAIKGIREAATGEVKVGTAKVKLTPAERAIRALSGQPTRISIAREKVSGRYDLQNEYKAIQTRAKDMADQAVDADGKIDYKALTAAKRYQRDWEAKNRAKMQKYSIQKQPAPTPKFARRGRKTLRQIERMD